MIADVEVSIATPGVDQLGHVVGALRDWQRDSAPVQLHPGDLGSYQRFGAERLAAALRVWSSSEGPVAIGFLDGPDVLRMTVVPDAWHDEDVARRVVADATDPQRGVLPAGEVAIEAPAGTRVRELLDEVGWRAGEAWAPLRRDLSAPVEAPDLRIAVIEAGREADFTAVHRSAWGSDTFTDELWRAMVAGSAVVEARCLLGYDDLGAAVAGVTVWSAGPSKPGLLEPMGVHADHRGRGHGRAICLAAAAELRRLGSSSALVCTTSSLTAAVATYRSAGFDPLPERLDRIRQA